MKNHARLTRSNYSSYLRPERRADASLRRTLFGKKLAEINAQDELAKSPDYDDDIESYIYGDNGKDLPSLAVSKEPVVRTSLFRKTIVAPYHHKHKEVRYQPKTVEEKAHALINKRRKLQKKASRRTRLRLASAFTVLMLVAIGGNLVGNFRSNDAPLARLFDDTMTVSGPPIDVSSTPEVLGVQTQAKDPSRVPASVNIPSLNLNAQVEPVGIHTNGTVALTQDHRKVGWYKSSAPSGANSTVLLVGYRFGETPIFSSIDQLHTGDVVELRNVGGESFWYQISSIDFYAAKDVPLAKLVTIDQGESLVLAGNSGDWDETKKEFSERIIVVAKPVKRN